jgi:hypothetical protein
MPGIVEAPWTDQQVAALNRWQHAGHVHAFTCPSHHEESRILIARSDGWHCPGCGYTQTWAHAMMTLGPPPKPEFRR